MSVLAIIPARAGSKGIPGKNLRTLGGKSLIQHAVECALATPTVSLICVHSDYTFDQLHAAGVPESASVKIHHIQRKPELSQDDTPMFAVVDHAITRMSEYFPELPFDTVALLQPTQPFRTPAHVTAAITLLRESHADSVVSVTAIPPTHHPNFVCYISKYLPNPGCLELRECGPDGEDTFGLEYLPACRQDVETAYRRDGTVYAFWRKTVTKYANIYGYKARPLIIPPDESCELDTKADWLEVERRWQARHG